MIPLIMFITIVLLLLDHRKRRRKTLEASLFHVSLGLSTSRGIYVI